MAGTSAASPHAAPATDPRIMPARCESSIAGRQGEALLTFDNLDIRLE
jgi:hypothetical protein